MVRLCKVKGCKVREGQGKQLFSFPKEPGRRTEWISRTGRVDWSPRATSCICEIHFDVQQWEQIREDGSRVLRLSALPTLPPIIGTTDKYGSHDHTYSAPSQYLLADIEKAGNVAQKNERTSFFSKSEFSDINCSVQSSVDNEPQPKNQGLRLHEDPSDALAILAGICDASRQQLSLSTIIPKSPTVQELQEKLKKQKAEIEALQREHELLKNISSKAYKNYFSVKAKYDKCKMKLWRSEQSKMKAQLTLTSRLHPDQLKALSRKSNAGFKWSSETIRDALGFKMKWGTKGFSEFVQYLPIFPSIRTLQREVKQA